MHPIDGLECVQQRLLQGVIVPEQRRGSARVENRRRLGQTDRGIHPVPRVAGRDEIEGPAQRIPLLEGRNVDLDPTAASHSGHPFIRLDAENGNSSLDQRPRDLARSAADIKDTDRLEADQVVYQRFGIRGTEPVVLLRFRSERGGAISVPMKPFQRHTDIVARTAKHVRTMRVGFVMSRSGGRAYASQDDPRRGWSVCGVAAPGQAQGNRVASGVVRP